jgi:glycosyltransferase involved in cell wall biosynthesis/CDP-glycerol glycerophosphotransferase (TagB/SpsB family)
VPTPLISVVVPTYNVARYLPDFLSSLQRQTYPLAELDFVFVDDGSTDASGDVVREWADRVAPFANVVSQPNGGLAAARNTGLEFARGQWVTFTDPDDMLSPNYFEEIAGFVRGQGADVQLVAARLMILIDGTNEVVDRHPLRFKFTRGRQVVDLDRHPKYIHLQAASAFYRREVIEGLGLRFDGRIRPSFEDAALTTRYLSHFDHPLLGLVPEAQYLYRRRLDGSSLVQASWARAEKYLDVPRFGYLETLREIAARRGWVPVWAQHVILYDLFFYFREDLRNHSATVGLPSEVTDRFHQLLREVMTYIDAETVASFEISTQPRDVREALILGAKREHTRPAEVSLTELDQAQQLVRLSYYFTGALPAEEFRGRGLRIEPVHAKVRDVRFFGRRMVSERIVWLPASGTIRVRLDGRAMRLRVGPPYNAPYLVGPVGMWRTLANRDVPVAKAATRRSRIRRRLGRVKRALLAQRRRWRGLQLMTGGKALRTVVTALSARAVARVSPRYNQAWLLIDRDSHAQDNAEHLYRYLRAEQPQVNAWFVLSRDSSDWARLDADGFRLIRHDSFRHKIALLICEHVISSQIDHYIVAPLRPSIYGPPRWRFTFLQHGVTHNDLSRWINPKPISRMVTATHDEQVGIVGDGTPYVYTTKEVRLTGFPRHDRLLDLGRTFESHPRPFLLVMPTWRRELLGDQLRGGNNRQLRADFWSTAFAQAWYRLLASPELKDIADQASWQIAFMPHPNMQGYLDGHELPAHIEVHLFDETDVQEVIARGSLMVTDYSSVAFETAYLRRPVVYYQFDRAAFFSGTHVFRRGAWSYEDDGFGPVVADHASVLAEIRDIAARGGEPEPEYAKRMQVAFPFRDGQCSRRTYESIRDLTRPVSDDVAYRPVS